MSGRKSDSPAFFKWWAKDWRGSTLRIRLKTPTLRGIYRELWDFLMSCPDPGRGVDTGGKPFSISEITKEIGCRKDHLTIVIQTAKELGSITIGAGYELLLNRKATEKSLPDHWKYKRLKGKSSESRQEDRALNQNQSQNQITPYSPPVEDVELPKRKNPSTESCQHLNNLIRQQSVPLPTATEEMVQKKLFGAGLSPEDILATTAYDLSSAIREWRDHQKKVRKDNPTGRSPNWGLGYLKNVLFAKRDKEWQRKKAGSGPAAAIVHFPAADPRMTYWHSLSTADQKKHTQEMHTKHPELTTWPQWRDRWLKENKPLWEKSNV